MQPTLRSCLCPLHMHKATTPYQNKFVIKSETPCFLFPARPAQPRPQQFLSDLSSELAVFWKAELMGWGPGGSTWRQCLFSRKCMLSAGRTYHHQIGPPRFGFSCRPHPFLPWHHEMLWQSGAFIETMGSCRLDSGAIRNKTASLPKYAAVGL